jgi:hypothetical protein
MTQYSIQNSNEQDIYGKWIMYSCSSHVEVW